MNDPVELEKFLNAATFATLAVLSQETNTSNISHAEFIGILNGVLDAPLPDSLKNKLFSRVGTALLTGEIVPDPDQIDGYTYDAAQGSWWIRLGVEKITITGELEDSLNARRDFRLEQIELGLATSEEIVTAIVMEFNSEQNQQCFLAGTKISMADGSKKSIENIEIDDEILAYSDCGELLPGKVSRLYTSDVRCVLDVHGMMITPGHVTYCAAGQFAEKHVPIIDILLSDGAVMTEDGRLMRLSTDVEVGELLDSFVELCCASDVRAAQAENFTRHQVRLGTKILLEGGCEKTLWEMLTSNGFEYDQTSALVVGPSGKMGALKFLGRCPQPEDYILRKSGLTLADIFNAGEWRENQVRSGLFTTHVSVASN